MKGNYVSIHSSGFRDFLLKPEVLRAIVDCGFEHPSEIQHECIPQVGRVVGMVMVRMMRRAGVWKHGEYVAGSRRPAALPEVASLGWRGDITACLT